MDRSNDLAFVAESELVPAVRGEVLTPGVEGFDEARALWNARVDRRPDVIVRCRGTRDVMAAVDVARRCDAPIAVKGGGHHVSGTAALSEGIMLDLGAMDAVSVDPDRQTVQVGPGARWGQVDRETQAFDLAVPAGQDPDIGVAGLTLGGGVGWLSRRFGLTCDNLRSVEVVTAEGERVRATADQHSDLFWALRGGGGGGGIVTGFAFDAHPLGPDVFAGSLVYPMDAFQSAARHYRSFMADAPRPVRLLLGSMVLPDASVYPASLRGTRAAIIIGCYAGDPAEGRRVFDPLRERNAPAADTFRTRSYLDWQGVGQSRGRMRTYVRSQFLAEATRKAIDTMADALESAPSRGATIFVSPRSGAETEPSVEATAYPHRRDAHHVLVETRWTDPGDDEAHVDWTRSVAAAIQPDTTGAVAMNFLTADEPIERVRAAYGDNLPRLLEVVSQWDPRNRLRTSPHLDRLRMAPTE